jgi:hypothetical protein
MRTRARGLCRKPSSIWALFTWTWISPGRSWCTCVHVYACTVGGHASWKIRVVASFLAYSALLCVFACVYVRMYVWMYSHMSCYYTHTQYLPTKMRWLVTVCNRVRMYLHMYVYISMHSHWSRHCAHGHKNGLSLRYMHICMYVCTRRALTQQNGLPSSYVHVCMYVLTNAHSHSWFYAHVQQPRSSPLPQRIFICMSCVYYVCMCSHWREIAPKFGVFSWYQDLKTHRGPRRLCELCARACTQMWF